MTFIREDKTALNNAQSMHPLANGVHDSKCAHVPKVDILNTCCKLICVHKQRNSITRKLYCN